MGWLSRLEGAPQRSVFPVRRVEPGASSLRARGRTWRKGAWCPGLAWDFPKQAPARLWGLVEVIRRVWEGSRRSAWSERVPLPSPCLCQKFGVSRSETLSPASKTVLPTSSRGLAPMAFLLGPVGVHHRTRRRLSDGTSALLNVVGMSWGPSMLFSPVKGPALLVLCS